MHHQHVTGRSARFVALAAILGFAIPIAADAQHGAEGRNMNLVGYNDLQARSAYMPVIHQQGNRRIAYIGHHGGAARNPMTGQEELNGTSIVDVTDPKDPKEIAYYIPATTDKTDKRCVKTAEGERCKIAIQTNNVEVDDRGHIYIVDRADTGMHILELTGEARKIASFR